MAKGRIKLTSPQPWEGRIDWESSAVPGKNASSVRAECWVWRTDGGESFGNNPYWGRLSIGKTQEPFSFPRINGEKQHVASCWAEIPHDSEGKATVEISAEVFGSDNNDLTGSTLEGSKVVALEDIAPAGPSRLTLSASSLQMGKKLLISIDRDQPECYHTLSYSFGGVTETLGTDIKSSYAWTVPDLAAYCETEGLCTITCRTFLGSKDLGERSAELTLLLPDPTKAVLSQGVLGTDAVISCKRNSGNFSLEISLILNGQEYPVGKGKTDALHWTPPYDLAKALKDQTVLKGVLSCRTFNGAALAGRVESPIALTVPENEVTRPKITKVTLGPEAPETLQKYGYLLGKTGLRASMEGSSACSDIGTWTVKAGRARAEGNPAVMGVLQDHGTVTVEITARDLRGFQTSVIRQIQVTPYEKPRIVPHSQETRVICERADQQGALTADGLFLAIRAGIRFTGIAPEGKELNSCSLSWRLKEGEAPFGPWRPLITDGRQEIRELIGGLIPSLQKSYRAELMAEDALGEQTVLSFPILSQAVSFGLYDGVDGAAFGKYPEAPHVVDVAEHMTLLIRGRLELRGETWQSLGLAPGILPPREATGNGEGCFLRLSGGKHVVIRFSCRMPEGTAAVNENPVPVALRLSNPVSALCPSEGGAVLVRLDPDGFLRVSPLLGEQNPAWIDGSLDYWT